MKPKSHDQQALDLAVAQWSARQAAMLAELRGVGPTALREVPAHALAGAICARGVWTEYLRRTGRL